MADRDRRNSSRGLKRVESSLGVKLRRSTEPVNILDAVKDAQEYNVQLLKVRNEFRHHFTKTMAGRALSRPSLSSRIALATARDRERRMSLASSGTEPFWCATCGRSEPEVKKYARQQCQTCYKRSRHVINGTSERSSSHSSKAAWTGQCPDCGRKDIKPFARNRCQQCYKRILDQKKADQARRSSLSTEYAGSPTAGYYKG
eukprot:GILK01007887.1.p1 GENE.GILK01007887.1~~GILK01007887.1.p1  ORF type:complete len:227 (-),score=3.86 GILK01007887.1:37-642(-)